jgi:hypothetical protein
MKKLVLIMLWSTMVGFGVHAQGGRQLSIDYQHSRRGPYNTIGIELKSEHNAGEVYYIKVYTKGDGGEEYRDTENIINIEPVPKALNKQLEIL